MRYFTTQRRWLVGMLVLLVAGLILVPVAVAQGNEASQLTVVAEAINVRSGPALAYPSFNTLRQGDQVPVVGYDAAGGWWQVKLYDGSIGWVSGGAEYVSITGDIRPTFSGLPTHRPETINNSYYKDNPVGQFTGDNLAQKAGAEQLIGTLVFQTISGGPIYAVNSECLSLPGGCDTNLRYLTDGMDPALSPDGQWVAFTRWDNPQLGARGSLWLINVDGSDERKVAENIFQPKSPTWSPDGSQIILSMTYGERLTTERKCSGQRPPREATDITIKIEGKDDIVFCYTLLPNPDWGLRRVNVATGQAEDLNYDTNSISPTWNPLNPQQVVYDGPWGLVNLDLSSGKTSPLTTDVQQRSPVFSPDGRKLAVSYRQDDHWEIHVLNGDGSGGVRLTETSYLVWVQQELSGQAPYSYNNAAPVWSPDGRQIAFITDRAGVWEIWVMNADGSQQRPLVSAQSLAGLNLQYQSMDERMLSWR